MQEKEEKSKKNDFKFWGSIVQFTGSRLCPECKITSRMISFAKTSVFPRCREFSDYCDRSNVSMYYQQYH